MRPSIGSGLPKIGQEVNMGNQNQKTPKNILVLEHSHKLVQKFMYIFSIRTYFFYFTYFSHQIIYTASHTTTIIHYFSLSSLHIKKE